MQTYFENLCFIVPRAVLFSNQFLHDLDVLWELHEWMPDPTNPTYRKR